MLTKLVNVCNTLSSTKIDEDLIKECNKELDNKNNNFEYDELDNVNLAITKLLDSNVVIAENEKINLSKLNFKLEIIKSKLFLKKKIVETEEKKNELIKNIKNFKTRRMNNLIDLVKTQQYSNEILQSCNDEMILRQNTTKYYEKKLLSYDELLEIMAKRLECLNKILNSKEIILYIDNTVYRETHS